MFLPKQGFRPESEIPSRHPSSSLAYIEKFLKLKYTVSMPEKILISIWGRMESLGNDDVSIVHAHK